MNFLILLFSDLFNLFILLLSELPDLEVIEENFPTHPTHMEPLDLTVPHQGAYSCPSSPDYAPRGLFASAPASGDQSAYAAGGNYGLAAALGRSRRYSDQGYNGRNVQASAPWNVGLVGGLNNQNDVAAPPAFAPLLSAVPTGGGQSFPGNYRTSLQQQALGSGNALMSKVDDDESDEDNNLCLPGMAGNLQANVSETIKKKILSKKYVKFEAIFDKPRGNVDRSDKVLSFDDWTSAWNAFHFIYVSAFPESAPSLVQYFEHIRTAFKISKNAKHCGWMDYDRAFRKAIAGNPNSYSWGQLDVQLWTLTVLSGAGRVGIAEGQQHNFRRSGLQFKSAPVCFKFNSRNGCDLPRCSYRHACSHCEGPHAQWLCKK